MSLDDAVNAAKARQEQQAQMARSHQEQERQEEAEIKALLQEAAERLSERASRSEEFVRVAPALLFGGYTSERRRFKVVRRDRCWVLSTGEARRTRDSELVPSSVLLLESGVMGRFYQEQHFHPQAKGEFVTTSRLVLLKDHDLFWGSWSTNRVDALKQELATAILHYGAA